MKRSSLTFAGIFSKIMPEENISSAQTIVRRNNYFDSNILINEEGKSYIVKIANNEEGTIELKKEILINSILEGLTKDATFDVPKFVKKGTVNKEFVSIFAVPAGRFFKEHNIGDVRLTAIIQVLREIHDFPRKAIEDAKLPVYSAQEFRQLFIDDLNKLKKHKVLDIELEKHFSEFLSNDNHWKFDCSVIHGNAQFKNFLFQHDYVKNIIGWNEIKIGDPAYDLALILSPFSKNTCLENLKTYRLLKGNKKHDPYLERRVRFYSEFQMARWLLYGVETGDKEIVHSGTNMLLQLKEILDNEQRIDETKKQYEVAKLQDELETQHIKLQQLQSESNITSKTIDNLDSNKVKEAVEKTNDNASNENDESADESAEVQNEDVNNDDFASDTSEFLSDASSDIDVVEEDFNASAGDGEIVTDELDGDIEK